VIDKLTDASGEVLDANVTWWALVGLQPMWRRMPAIKVDIAGQIKKTIQRIE
jgi:hypothetical protein